MAAVEAIALVTRAIDSLRDARDALDEAAEFSSLPVDLASALHAYESAVNAIRTLLIELAGKGSKPTEGPWLPDSGKDVVRAMAGLLEPTARWTESMAKLDRHLARHPQDDEPED